MSSSSLSATTIDQSLSSAQEFPPLFLQSSSFAEDSIMEQSFQELSMIQDHDSDNDHFFFDRSPVLPSLISKWTKTFNACKMFILFFK